METATGEAIPPRNASQLDLGVPLEEAHVAQRRAGITKPRVAAVEAGLVGRTKNGHRDRQVEGFRNTLYWQA